MTWLTYYLTLSVGALILGACAQIAFRVLWGKMRERSKHGIERESDIRFNRALVQLRSDIQGHRRRLANLQARLIDLLEKENQHSNEFCEIMDAIVQQNIVFRQEIVDLQSSLGLNAGRDTLELEKTTPRTIANQFLDTGIPSPKIELSSISESNRLEMPSLRD